MKKMNLIFTTSLMALSLSAVAAPNSDELIYNCKVQRAQPEFPMEFELQLDRAGKYMAYFAPNGENCLGNRDFNYRQRPSGEGGSALLFSKYITDCEGDGFLEVLVSESLAHGQPSGIAKIRTHRNAFTQVFYSCKAP